MDSVIQVPIDVLDYYFLVKISKTVNRTPQEQAKLIIQNRLNQYRLELRGSGPIEGRPSRRYATPEMPIKSVSLANAGLFKEDINFIQDKGQHPRTIAREAIHFYCEAWRTSSLLSDMPKTDRDQWIMKRVPIMKVLHTQPDPNIYATLNPCPTIQTHTPENIITRPSADAMSSWSKPQRDVYIMYGTVP